MFLYLLACLQDFAGGLLWNVSRRNKEVTQRCSNLHPSLRPGVTISRKCNDDGTWGPVDDSSCTALNNAIPILIVSFAVNVSQSDAEDIVDNVSLNEHVCIYVHIHVVITILKSLFHYVLDYMVDKKQK